MMPLLRQPPGLTRHGIAALAGITADGVKDHMDKMKFAGQIRRQGPLKGGKSEVLK